MLLLSKMVLHCYRERNHATAPDNTTSSGGPWHAGSFPGHDSNWRKGDGDSASPARVVDGRAVIEDFESVPKVEFSIFVDVGLLNEEGVILPPSDGLFDLHSFQGSTEVAGKLVAAETLNVLREY